MPAPRPAPPKNNWPPAKRKLKTPARTATRRWRAAARVRELSGAQPRHPARPGGRLWAKRGVQVGQRVQPGAPLMAIVPLEFARWTPTSKKASWPACALASPSPCTPIFMAAASPTTARWPAWARALAVFSLLPAQNATGNWIKVVQRVPVRITLDPKELSEHPLRVGLSMLAEVTNMTNPPGAGHRAAPGPAQSTTAFAGADQAAQARIARIIADNLGKDRS